MNTFVLLAVSLFWAIFGSFASAIIPRIHEKKNFVSKRSECPECNHELGILDLFPIFSFLFLRGKCRHCGAKIPMYHFLLEVSMAIGFFIVAKYIIGVESILEGNIASLIFLLVSMFVTVVFCAYDLMYMEIPDELLIPFLVIVFFMLCGAKYLPFQPFWHFIPFESRFLNIPLFQAMLGALPIFLFFLLLILVSSGRWMGGGDLRVAMFMGFVSGAKIAWLWLFLSYIVGSVIGIIFIAIYQKRNMMIPFWPFLAIGLWSAFLWYNPIMNWYLSYLQW